MTQNNQKSRELKMTFDPNTIQHLGIKMYSYLPAAIAELVANAYDADAREVHIRLFNTDKDGKSIIVEDDGHGMSFDEVNSYFLNIGRNRRSENLKNSPGGRIATGKKGLGKLALFGIGSEILVSTKKYRESKRINFTLNWVDLKNWDREKFGPDYKPSFEEMVDDIEKKGTIIKISQLKRHSDFSVEELSKSLSRMFNFLDANFRVFLSLNNGNETEITNELKYQSLKEQFAWIFPKLSENIESDYARKKSVIGKIFTTKTPLKPGQRGITLFANGRMVNAPEFFGSSESSHFFSYTTGWLNVDFIDELDGENDAISTNRQSLDWEKKETFDLRIFLQKILAVVHKDWRIKRKEENKKEAGEKTGINRKQWFATIPVDKAEIINTALEEVSDPDSERGYAEILEVAMHQIAPEYAELHWRYLHPSIHKIAEDEYKKRDYFKAAREAALLYIQRVRDMSGYKDKAGEDVDLIFNPATGILMVTNCSNETEKNIQMGQQHLSRGILFGCRNPLTHNPEFEKHLIDTGLFNEKVCLDMLAMISHLFTRLDNAKKRK